MHTWINTSSNYKYVYCKTIIQQDLYFKKSHILVLERVDNVKRGRGRPKLTWDESVKRDLKDWNISKEIALDRSAWRLAINVPEP